MIYLDYNDYKETDVAGLVVVPPRMRLLSAVVVVLVVAVAVAVVGVRRGSTRL